MKLTRWERDLMLDHVLNQKALKQMCLTEDPTLALEWSREILACDALIEKLSACELEELQQ